MLDAIQTTRRRMLLGLAAASTAAASSVGAASGAVSQEASELVSMGDRLGTTLDAYKAALERVQSIAATWGPHWPQPDPQTFQFGQGCERHADILGRGISTAWNPSGVEQVRYIGTPEIFEAEAKREWAEYDRRMGFKTQRGAKLSKRWAERNEAAIEPARAYWAEVDRIKQASGIEAAQEAKTEAREALQELVGQIIKYHEMSITGLIIKAQALQAWGNVEPFYQKLNLEAVEWADAMAATILRQASASVA